MSIYRIALLRVCDRRRQLVRPTSECPADMFGHSKVRVFFSAHCRAIPTLDFGQTLCVDLQFHVIAVCATVVTLICPGPFESTLNLGVI